jgi:hypothetical protein
MRKEVLLDIFVTLLVAVAAYCLLQNIFLDQALSWKLQAASRMLAGGNYLHNFFDDGNPFLFAYFIPVVWLHEFTALTWSQAAGIYICLWTLLGSLLSYRVLLLAYQRSSARRWLYFGVLLALWLFSLVNFGQRECLLLALAMPYLLMQCLLEAEQRRGCFVNCLAVVAALSIAQFPFYLFLPFALDCLAWWRKEQGWHWRHTCLYGLSALLLLISFLLYPNYYTVIMPLIYHFEGGYDDLLVAVFNVYSLMEVAVLLLSLLLLNKVKLWRLWIITFISGVIYWLAAKAWFYHFYPLLALSIVLIALIVVEKDFDCSLKKSSLGSLVSQFLIYLVGLTLIACLGFNLFYQVLLRADPHAQRNQLLRFVKESVGAQSVIVLATRLQPSYSLTTYSQAKVVMPWGNLWLLPAVVNNRDQPAQLPGYFHAKKILFQQMANTLQQRKPTFVFVESGKHIGYLKPENFKIMKFYETDKVIKQAMSRYRFIKQVAGFDVYQLTNCKRKDLA